jgi:xylulokinase
MLVAGVDSSTQSCKVAIRDAETGELVRQGRAGHPDGTQCPPAAWWVALHQAVAEAGGLADVAALSIGAQQHGMVCLDADGVVVRDALLWNDTRSAQAATDLIAELGGAHAWADAVGSVPVAAFTVTKLRWLAQHEPQSAARTAAVCLPHDWLTWQLANGAAGNAGGGDLSTLTTDRSDASGTGYWSARSGAYRMDLLARALGHETVLPRVLGPSERAGVVAAMPRVGSAGLASAGLVLGPGAGDNAAAALGVNAEPGDVIVSIGTSGTVFAVATKSTADPGGAVAGFADATGHFLPLVCTLNAARVLDAAAAMLGVDHGELSRLALNAPVGSDGLVLVPYLEGERTPNRPDATGSLHGLTLATSTAAHLARAAIEGMLCALADGLDALVAQGATVSRVILIGGAARSEAVRRIAPTVFGCPVLVPPPGEYVATGAARQAAWALLGDAPQWTMDGLERYEADPAVALRARYADARDLILPRS